jgi:hypothetical protein
VIWRGDAGENLEMTEDEKADEKKERWETTDEWTAG